jgi:hypothetical protein
MPIFDNEFTFIHIPKCGGTSIESFLTTNGCKMALFTSTGHVSINGHTPQHCTYQELEVLNILTDKIFTIVRPEIDRVVSEYFYILEKRHDLKALFNNFDEFLDLFLNKNNYLLFDYHNVSNKDFLVDKNGIINSKIKIFNFFEFDKIENYLGLNGLNKIHEMKTTKCNILNNDHIIKINKFYDENS